MWWNRSRSAPEVTNDKHASGSEDGDAENGYSPSGRGKMPSANQATICGIRKKVFFFVILGGVLIAVAAVAIGVGAGIAFNKSQSYVLPNI